MVTHVTVMTGARLHFGPLAPSGNRGGKFGGIGMMISAPRYVLSARAAEVDSVVSEESTAVRISQFVCHVRDSMPFGTDAGPCEINVHETIPAHCGFGSGTQLGLAVASSLSQLSGEPNVALETLAQRAGRGMRSAIGMYGFAQGGCLVDGGRSGGPGHRGVLVTRHEFPSEWRIVLASPGASTGLCGLSEQQAFDALPAMSLSMTGELCRIVLMDWLPALVDCNFSQFSSATYEYGSRVGRFFEPAQGGTFAHKTMESLVDHLRRRGIQGVAQTSWGPTIAAFFPNLSEANQLVQDLKNTPQWSETNLQIVAPLNRGAFVEISNSDGSDLSR